MKKQSKTIQPPSVLIQVFISFTSDHFRALYYRALCHEKLGNHSEEEKDYQRALEVQPTNINALYHLGLLKEKLENYD